MDGLHFGHLWSRVDTIDTWRINMIDTWITIRVIKVVDIHMDEERGELPEKTFVHENIHGNLDCWSWV